MSKKTVREAVAIFHEVSKLHEAADELMISGFDRSDLSILAGRKAVEQKLGHMFSRVEDAEDDPRIATQAYVGTDSINEAKAFATGGLFYVGALSAIGIIVASGGSVAAALIGAAVAGGAGGILGTYLGHVLDKPRADYINDQINKGGILLWVHTKDPEHEALALKILNNCSADDAHIHELPEVKYDGAMYGYLDWLAGEPKPEQKPATIISGQ